MVTAGAASRPQQPPWPHGEEDELDATQPGERLAEMMAAQLTACDDPKSLGRLGEAFAAAVLAEQGWHIVDRNYRTRFGELDLICVDEHGQVVFVEVKTRSGMGFGGPREAITTDKQRHLRRAASLWMQREPWPRGCRGVRFDLVGVVVHEGVHVDHVKGAF